LGAIWIGTYESGINRYDTVTKKITHFESSNGYPDKNCWAAFESRDGVLWLSSTDPVGFLYRMVLDKNKIKHIPTLKFIHCITEDKQGYLWGAGFQTGLLQFDKNRNLLHVFKEETADSIDLIKNGATSILQENDTLWLCNSKGVILMDKKSQHFKWLRYKRPGDLVENKFTGINTFQIINDKNLYKWIWTNRGLYQYNSQNHTFIVHHLLVDEFEEPTNPLLQDGLGNIWAASLDGIEIFNSVSGHIKSLMKGIKVNCLYRDEEGFIWAGSLDRGLFRYNKGTDSMEVFSDFQSVPGGEKIVNIAVDDWKNLWVITNSAIVKYVADRSRFFVYSKSYGIRSNELWVGGICKTRAGEILVGNARGFYVISPGEMNEVSSPLQLNITGFYVNNKPAFSTNDRILTGPVEQTTSLHLPYNKNDFSFSFAAIDYRAPETNRYYTRLENFDSVWRDAGGDKTANYINIPPGRYIFKVKAINIDNITSEKDVDITISPPWYKTWWAYLIYVLLIITLVVVIHRYQQQRTIRREREKAQVKELAQAREIERAYTELKSTQAQLIQSEKMASLGEMTAGIAHEIQNPLNFVNNFSELNKELAEDLIAELGSDNYRSGDVQSPSEIAEDIKKNEVKINYHGRRADAIVKSMLQHSQGSFGTKEPTDINELADKYLRLAYHSIGTKDSIPVPVGIKTDFDDSVKKINIVPQEIGKVLLNLYNNALYEVRECAVIRLRRMEAASYELQTVNGDPPNGEASFYEPEVCVTTRRNGSYVVITVKDNGNGIPGNIIDKIFQPFFTTKPTGQGTGLGLSLAYDIVKAHGGSLRVESKMGEGSSFVVQLPG
jgi:signal transduction histidine kinase/ligand-binding sensor domain-containing protein